MPADTLRKPKQSPNYGCILVVEDEPTLRNAAARALEKQGFKVLLAADDARFLRRPDGPLRVAYRGIGRGTEHRAGRRVDRLEPAIALSGDQLAVDEQAFLVPHERKLSSHIGRIK